MATIHRKGMKNMKKQILTFLTAAAVISGAVSAQAGIVFTDINNVPWDGAKTYIQNVADMGLMVGESDGKAGNIFRAKDKVTYIETIQLTYNLLKEADVAVPSSAVTSKWKTIIAGYNVPEWAYEAVAYSLENKIISTSELRSFMSSSTGKSLNASRQDVAIIFGRGLSALYDVNDDPTLAFNDSSYITDTAAPYVDLLSSLNILVGDSDKNFNPKADINRAEMAVIVSKTHTVLSGGTIPDATEKVSGIISSVNVDANGAKTITLKKSSGNTVQFKGSAATHVSYNGQSVSFMDLTAGDEVTVEYSGKDIINVVLTYDAIVESSDFVTGTVNYMSEKTITVDLSNGKTAIYDVLPTTYITLNGQSAKVSEITAIVDNGIKVDVNIRTNGSKTALAVEATGQQGTVEGKITAINRETIKIKRTGGGEKEYKYAKTVTVRYEGTISTIPMVMEAFKDGKDVSVTAVLDDDGKISEFSATINTEGGTVWGIVKNISTEKVNLYSGSSYVAYYFADGVDVELDGDETTISKLDKLNENGTEFTATLYLNTKGKITKIAAELQDKTSGTISNITKDYIEIRTEYGKDYKYFLDDDVVVKFSGSTNEDIDALIAVYEKGITSVKLELNSLELVNRIVAYVEWDNFDTIKGEIENAETNSITIEGKKYKTGSDTVVYIDGTRAVAYDVYMNYISNVLMEATVTAVDDYAKKIDAKAVSAEGVISGMENGYITIKSGASTKKYPVLKSSELVVSIDGETKTYGFNELYDKWNNVGNNYKVYLKIKDGTVTRISAEKY